MIVTLTDAVLFSTYFILLFLSIFWLLIFFTGDEDIRKKKLQNYPFFTVIVPAYNEEESIAETLDSLLHLEYPLEKIEIIVVNDGSTDATKTIVEKFIQSHPCQHIKLLDQENKGKGAALNNGLRHARGEYFACLDADSFVSTNAVQEMLPYFADGDVAAVCPLLKVKNPDTVLQKVQWHEYVFNMFYKFLNAKLDCIHVTPGPFSIYRTAVIRDIGGYDEKNITEDLEIAMRLQKHQYKIIQTFEAVVETLSPRTWKQLFHQRVRWYKGAVDNSILYKNMVFNKHYGDFGFIRMPTIFLGGIITIVLFGTLLHQMLTKYSQWFRSLEAINFDLITLLQNFTFQINVLSWPFSKYFIALTLFGLSIFVMIYSYKVIHEKIDRPGKTWISLVTYLSLYAVFISVVWIYVGFLVLLKKKNSWS